jgi:hypothetical protein
MGTGEEMHRGKPMWKWDVEVGRGKSVHVDSEELYHS